MLIYNNLTEFFADFRHFCRAVILLIFSYLHYKNSINAARWRRRAGNNCKQKFKGRTAARAAVHVVNIKPSTFQFHLFLCGGSAVGKRLNRRRPPLDKVYSAAFIHIEKGLFRAQNSQFWRLFSRRWHIGCKYVNVRNSRYLGLFGMSPSTVRRTVLTR